MMEVLYWVTVVGAVLGLIVSLAMYHKEMEENQDE